MMSTSENTECCTPYTIRISTFLILHGIVKCVEALVKSCIFLSDRLHVQKGLVSLPISMQV